MRVVRAMVTVVGVTVSATALASSPAGVWSLPSSVTVTGADSDTPEVVIHGLFTVWSGEGEVGGDWGMKGYEAAAWGVMAYRCKADEKALCLMQWDELKTAARDAACVGWGNQEAFAGTVHPEGTLPETPDSYVIDAGVVSGFTPCQYLAGIAPPVEPAPEASPEEIPEPGPEPTPEPAAEASDPIVDATTAVDTAVSVDTSPATDASITVDASAATDTASPVVPSKVDDEGGGCNGGALALGPALAALVALAFRRRR